MGDTDDQASTALSRFYLQDWYVDADTNRLCRGEHEVRLESKVMAVLLCLARQPGELLTREVLESAVWGQTVVGYDALTRCIARLRKALDDDPRQPMYIETISKKGYRLIAPVRPAEPAPAVPVPEKPVTLSARYRPWWLAAAVVCLSVLAVLVWSGRGDDADVTTVSAPALPSVVVLPFRHLGDDGADRYFSDGVTADISTELSRLSGLFVIAHASASRYRDQLDDHHRVAGSLGARYIVDGSIRRSGNRLRINVQLLDAGTNAYLWSEKYDRDVHDIFAVQDSIVSNIVNALSVKLTEQEKQRTARKYTVSLDAYDDFLKAQSLYSHHTREDNRQARQFYRRALERDSLFARAYSALALTYTAEHRYGWDDTHGGDTLGQALQFAERAVALDPDLPQAHWAVGYVQLFRRDYDTAQAAATRAVTLDPNYADSYLILAVCALFNEQPAEAVRQVRKAMLLNPEYPGAYASVLGQAYYYMQRHDEAVAELRKAVERNANLLTARVFLIAALVDAGHADEANWAVQELKSIAPDFTADKALEMLPVRNEQGVAMIRQQLRQAGL